MKQKLTTVNVLTGRDTKLHKKLTTVNVLIGKNTKLHLSASDILGMMH